MPSKGYSDLIHCISTGQINVNSYITFPANVGYTPLGIAVLARDMGLFYFVVNHPEVDVNLSIKLGSLQKTAVLQLCTDYCEISKSSGEAAELEKKKIKEMLATIIEKKESLLHLMDISSREFAFLPVYHKRDREILELLVKSGKKIVPGSAKSTKQFRQFPLLFETDSQAYGSKSKQHLLNQLTEEKKAVAAELVALCGLYSEGYFKPGGDENDEASNKIFRFCQMVSKLPLDMQHEVCFSEAGIGGYPLNDSVNNATVYICTLLSKESVVV